MKITQYINEYKSISYTSIGICIFVLVYGFSIFFNFETSERTYFNYFVVIATVISTIGSFASLIGLLLAYVQIVKIKDNSEYSNRMVQKALDAVDMIILVSDISKSIPLLREIQGYILRENLQMAQLRMKDLKPILLLVNSNDKILILERKEEFGVLFTTFSVNLNTLDSVVLKQKKGINAAKINQNLEDISTLLIESQQSITKKNFTNGR